MMYRYDENSKPVQHVFVSIAIFRTQKLAKTKSSYEEVVESFERYAFSKHYANYAIKFDSIVIWILNIARLSSRGTNLW